MKEGLKSMSRQKSDRTAPLGVRRDKNIIQKIRSYYEAAAEAEDDGGSVEDGESDQEEEGKSEGEERGEEETGRNSFSQTSNTLVRDSVTIPAENTEDSKMAAKAENGGGVSQNGGEVCVDVSREEERVQKKCEQKRDEIVLVQMAEPKNAKSCNLDVYKTGIRESNPNGDEEEEEVKHVSRAGRVGRWSRHSRIVSANRALFEGMASDVERIGLFEASPVVLDLVLLENSERILNKVQTLARMYSAKANHVQEQQQRKAFSQSCGSGAGLMGAARGTGQSQSRKVSANEKRSFRGAEESPVQIKNQTRTQHRTHQSPGPRPDWTTVQDHAAADHVTVRELLSSNGVDSSTSPDVVSTSRSEGGLGPGPTQDQSSVLGHSSSDRPLKTSTHPHVQTEDKTQDSRSGCDRASVKAKTLHSGSRGTHPGLTRQLSQNQAPQLGYGSPDVPLWEAGDPTAQKTDFTVLELCTPKTDDVSRASVVNKNIQGEVKMELLIQFPHEKVNKQHSDDAMAEEATAKQGNVSLENQTSTVTHPGSRQEPENKAPCLGHKSRDTPLSQRGPAKEQLTAESTQKQAPFLGYKSRESPSIIGAQLKEQRNTSTIAHPGFTETQARKEESNVGHQSRDIPLSSPGGPTVFESNLPSPLPSSNSATTGNRVRGSSFQSPVWPKDSLPTFTNQRPSDLPRATSSYSRPFADESREQRPSGPSPRPSSRPGLESPALAALLPSPGLSSTSAFKPNIHQRPPSPVYSPPENHIYQDLRPSNPALRSTKPTPSSVFTRSLAASCISQSISQSMSKKTLDNSTLPSTYLLRQRSPSPKRFTESNQQPKSFLWSPQSSANHPPRQNATSAYAHANANNNNNMASAYCSPHGANWVANGSDNVELTHEYSWCNFHNRVAQPFCTSEPNSRVPSPTPFPHSAPQHDLNSPLANKPPNPRRPGSTNNPLGLTLDINRASSMNSSLSPRIMSPPPVGASGNSWTNHITAPQPRNSSFSLCPSPTSAYTSSLRNSRSSSPSPPFSPSSQSSLRRSHSTTLADRPPSPARSNPSGVRRSWVETSRRSLTFNGPFNQSESSFHTLQSGYSSPALACLSPRTTLQSPGSPSRFNPGRSPFSGQQFAGVPWSDEISRSFGDFSSARPEVPDWGHSQVEDGTCRSQIICAYVARSSPVPPAPPSPVKPANQKMSYATTVNLQIAGSGRIKSFSTAQVSLTQTLQHGTQPQGALARRVSVPGAPQ
ncbi:hypothetical protein NQD34_010041 [Periophthalmus magnuspinnatus]|nr:hypothetical protein NQD34_010041 [Periophthalmus magnuspinnatus]